MKIKASLKTGKPGRAALRGQHWLPSISKRTFHEHRIMAAVTDLLSMIRKKYNKSRKRVRNRQRDYKKIAEALLNFRY